VRGHGLRAGWHEARIEATGAGTVTTRILVVEPGPRLGVVSDIDDTAMVSHVPRMFVAAWNQLVKYTSSREPVPGMSTLLTRVKRAHPGTPVIYLSTGAWNVVPTHRSFFKRHGFPAGPMLMTDWGPTNTGLFRSGIDATMIGLDVTLQTLLTYGHTRRWRDLGTPAGTFLADMTDYYIRAYETTAPGLGGCGVAGTGRGAPATSGPARRRRGRLLSAHVLSNRALPRIHSPSALSEACATLERRCRWPEPLRCVRMGA